MIETLIPALLQSASNIYLIILLTLLVVVYALIEMFSSGQIYRIRISKADTILNIIEKLIEKKDVQLTDYQKCAQLL
ncbi:MAG: hypothetical protein ACYCYL_10635 [Acidithiobacillus sp.]